MALRHSIKRLGMDSIRPAEAVFGLFHQFRMEFDGN
jgi:hypothetical protein